MESKSKPEQIHLLLIEDDPGDADLLQEILFEKYTHSFTVDWVDRLRAGLERLKQGDIDLVLLDLCLPDSCSLETFTSLQSQAPNLPIVVLSGLDDAETAIKAVQAGAQDYLIKDEIDSNVLVRSLRYAIERKKGEWALQLAHAELEQRVLERTEELRKANLELEAFAHTVAHDLQSPLSLIIGYAELVKQEYDLMSDEEVVEHIQTIGRHGRKMHNIIQELLLLAGVRKAEVINQPLDMAPIVAEAQQRLLYTIKEYGATFVMPTVWPVAMGYGPWVEEVWVNYLSNALKYGGRPPVVELGARIQNDGMVCFWVRDNGEGLNPESQARLFTPFVRLDQVRAKGSGLGLSIVRRIIEEKLGGKVGVESAAGQGSVFSFTLPGLNQENQYNIELQTQTLKPAFTLQDSAPSRG